MYCVTTMNCADFDLIWIKRCNLFIVSLSFMMFIVHLIRLQNECPTPVQVIFSLFYRPHCYLMKLPPNFIKLFYVADCLHCFSCTNVTDGFDCDKVTECRKDEVKKFTIWTIDVCIMITCPCNENPLYTPLLYRKTGVYRGIHLFIYFCFKTYIVGTR